jgi:hypothetical protein
VLPVPPSCRPMGRMSGYPVGASVSIRFDVSRCFRARHQDRRATAPMARAKRGPRGADAPTLARRCRAPGWSYLKDKANEAVW